LSGSEENFTTLPFFGEETIKSFKTIRPHMFLRMLTKSYQGHGLMNVRGMKEHMPGESYELGTSYYVFLANYC
jgi:hypothetical protein